VRHGTDKAIREILDEAFARLPANLPRDKVVPYRKELERRLAAMVAEARRKAATDLYLPVEQVHGIRVAASFVVSEMSLTSAELVDPVLIVSRLASEADGTSEAIVDGAAGVRTERTAGPDPARKVDYGSRRVDYVLPVPGDPDRWLVIAFSTLGGGDPGDQYAKVLVQLFDAIMSTFRWARV